MERSTFHDHWKGQAPLPLINFRTCLSEHMLQEKESNHIGWRISQSERIKNEMLISLMKKLVHKEMTARDA